MFLALRSGRLEKESSWVISVPTEKSIGFPTGKNYRVMSYYRIVLLSLANTCVFFDPLGYFLFLLNMRVKLSDAMKQEQVSTDDIGP